jgi:hypothetical protein
MVTLFKRIRFGTLMSHEISTWLLIPASLFEKWLLFHATFVKRSLNPQPS